jgi:heparin binding hemagglutinin HbhA
MRKQAEAGATVTFDAVKTPLFAVLGAVDAATHAELRKLTRAWEKAVREAYASLVERGEEVFDDLYSQPRVRQALGSVESGVDTAQERLEVMVCDLNSAAAQLRSRLARTSRSVGEQAAQDTERVSAAAAQQVQTTAGAVSEAVTEAGAEAAHATRSATSNVAPPATNRAAPPRRPASGPADNKTSRS